MDDKKDIQFTTEETKRLADFFLLLYKIDQRLKKEAAQNEPPVQACQNSIIYEPLGQENSVKNESQSALENNVIDPLHACQKDVME